MSRKGRSERSSLKFFSRRVLSEMLLLERESSERFKSNDDVCELGLMGCEELQTGAARQPTGHKQGSSTW